MSSSVKITEGTAPFKHPTLPKPCETWYKVYGDLKSSKSGRPLVTLHGGPGACHNYLLSLRSLADNYGIPVVFYDQLGNGNSTHIREKRLDESFWTPDLLMAELENLLEHLGIADGYDLLGQSWGGMMASMWGVRRPKGLRKLVISNSPASMPLWVAACNEWRKDLPRDIDDTLEKHERDQTYDDPAYKDAVMFFYNRHLCRIDPFPEEVMQSLEWIEKDDTVYRTMNGPSEFTVVGSLKTWDITKELHRINVPTLVLNGEFDEARDSCVYPYFSEIPKAKWYTFSNSSHMSNVEVPERPTTFEAEAVRRNEKDELDGSQNNRFS